MTRDEVLRRFAVSPGEHTKEIVTEGVWEGAPIFAPYFYEAYRAGRPWTARTRRNDEVLSLTYEVTQADRIAFPELLDVLAVALFVDLGAHCAFLHCEPTFRRPGGRPPNVEDEDYDGDEDEDEGV